MEVEDELERRPGVFMGEGPGRMGAVNERAEFVLRAVPGRIDWPIS